MVQYVEMEYTPYDWQYAIHQKKNKFTVLVLHRRAGKTVICVNELIKCAVNTPNSRYAYITPEQTQGKRASWDIFKKYARILPDVKFNEQELRIDFPNGSRIMLLGLSNAETLRGAGLNGMVLDETQHISEEIYNTVLLPMLVGTSDWWVIFAGTPMGHNWFYKLWNQSQSNDPLWWGVKLTVHETGRISDEELEIIKKTYAGNEAQYEQEFLCSFEGAIVGAYYKKQIEELQKAKKFTSVPYDKSYPVNTAWDLGMSDATAIWFFQCVGREIRLIDYEEHTGLGLPEWAKVIRDKPYLYDTHIGPHDIGVKEYSTGVTRVETAAKLGIDFNVIAPKLAVDEGINAVRVTLPKCVFDAEKCHHGIESLIHYRAEMDEVRGVLKPRPVHDRFSHGADAFRALALCYEEVAYKYNRTSPAKYYQTVETWNPLESNSSDYWA